MSSPFLYPLSVSEKAVPCPHEGPHAKMDGIFSKAHKKSPFLGIEERGFGKGRGWRVLVYLLVGSQEIIRNNDVKDGATEHSARMPHGMSRAFATGGFIRVEREHMISAEQS